MQTLASARLNGSCSTATGFGFGRPASIDAGDGRLHHPPGEFWKANSYIVKHRRATQAELPGNFDPGINADSTKQLSF
jgi:hypothetical protein